LIVHVYIYFFFFCKEIIRLIHLFKEIPLKARIRFQDLGDQHVVPTNGVPFVILGRGDRHCVFGKDKHKKKKRRQRNERDKLLQHDHPVTKRSRKSLQSSKKKDCPAKIIMKDVLLFPDYKVEESCTERMRRERSEKLRDDIRGNRQNISIDRRIYILLPTDEDHKDTHLLGEYTGFMKPLSKEVRDKLQELVGHGVSSVSEMKRHLRVFVETVLFSEQTKPSLSDAAYFPTDETIRKHIYRAMLRLRKFQNGKKSYPRDNFSFMPAASSPEFNEEDDITGVESLEQDDEDEVCPQMKTTETDFFFCHQSQFQRHLLYRYGNSLCLLDATYRTTKYALPLFFLAVKTNVGFSVVGEFVVQHETRSSIIQGLETIRTWMNEDPEKPENWEWNPKFFMTDFCEREIGAIEDVFAESFVFICDFHREQSWLRWTSKTDNGVTGTREKLLSMLRRVAHSCSTEEFEEAKLSLQNSERWVWAYRFGRGVLVNTNNGLERQNKLFKYTFLEQKKNNSLSAMVTTLVNDYLPSMMLKYIRDNATASDTVGRSYSSEVPVYLRNRPAAFIKHCLTKLELAESVFERDVECLTDNKYKVKSQTDVNGKSYYTVELHSADDLPKCDCHAWCWTLLPCKHMFAVLKWTEASWDDLPETYRSSPYLSLDNAFINVPISAPIVLNDTMEDDVQNDESTHQSDLELSTATELPLRKKTPRPMKALAVECREKLSLIQNATYMCQSVEALKKLSQLLQDSLNYISDNLYVDAGLTVQPQLEVNPKTKKTANAEPEKNSVMTPIKERSMRRKRKKETLKTRQSIVYS
ncbi:hypothetical protein FSP39_021404, partial [Pinctada imbricata]